jgi:hypothetical protein
MEFKISNLKNEFNNITLLRSKIMSVFETLRNKSDKLKIIYSEFIKQNNSQLFVFGLDSFHFQSKLIDLEYDDMQRIFIYVSNRMYCEYFKLYKLISSYVLENFNDKKILEIIKSNNFPIYKDLEPFNEYKFETIIEIHDNILILLNSIVGIVNNRENELSLHKSKMLIGLNIDNFIYSFNYEIILMREKVNLFLSCIEFFHKLHAKYLKRFSNKLQLLLNHINSDIHFDENIDETNNSNNSNNDDIKMIDENDMITTTNPINLINNENISHHSDSISEVSEAVGSGLNTPTNTSVSFNSIENSNNDFKIHKIFKKGIKKVANIFSGCNNKLVHNQVSNETILLEKLGSNIKTKNNLDDNDNYDNNNSYKLSINLNDFNDNISEIELQGVDYNVDIVIEESCEEELVIPITEEPNISVTEEVVESVEEPVIQQVTEEVVAPVEEPVIEQVTEEVVAPVEEPVIEQVTEEIVAPLEEPLVPVIEEIIELVEEPVAQVIEETVAPVEEHVTPVTEEIVELVEEPVAPVIEETVAPVEEHVTPVTEEVVVPLEEPVLQVTEEVVAPVEEPVTELQ